MSSFKKVRGPERRVAWQRSDFSFAGGGRAFLSRVALTSQEKGVGRIPKKKARAGPSCHGCRGRGMRGGWGRIVGLIGG